MAIKWGVIGCGDVTKHKSCPSFYKTEGSVLHSVYCRKKEALRDFSNLHPVKRLYSDLSAFLSDDELDIVYIATSNASHKEYAMKACDAGKMVLVEKPVTTSYEDTEELVNYFNSKGIPLFTAYYRRAIPYFLKIKEMVDNEECGASHAVNIRMRRKLIDVSEGAPWRVQPEIAGGGFFVDLASHELDLLSYYFGEAEEIFGVKSNMAGSYDAEDTVAGVVKFLSGVVAGCLWSFSSEYTEEEDICEIICSKGIIRFSFFSFAPIEVITESKTEIIDIKRPEHVHMLLVETIVDELTNKGKCLSDGDTALLSEKLLYTMLNKAFT